MSLPTYAEVRQTGLVWLPTVPSHWETKRLKYLVSFVGGGTPSKDNSEYWTGDIPWVSPKDMRQSYIFDTEDHITEEALENAACQLIPSGAVLVVVRSGILKHTIPVAINRVPVTLNQDMKAFIASKALFADYLAYCISGQQDSLLLEWRKAGATVESLEHEYISQTQWPIPPLNEQEEIVSFLDRKTAEIDALLGLQERQIERLEKKRQAVISEAVTRGVEATVPLRASGIEWLGDIAAHWRMKRLKFVAELINEKLNYVPEKFAYLGLENIESGTGKIIASPPDAEVQEASETGACTVFAPNDVLFGKLRPYLAKVIYAQTFGVCSSELLVLRSKVVGARFLFYYLLSDGFLKIVNSSTYGAKMPRASWDFIGSLPVLLPPLNEQEEIVSFLDRKTAEIDALLGLQERQIERLRAYRQVLISEAVTGKIDVRGRT